MSHRLRMNHRLLLPLALLFVGACSDKTGQTDSKGDSGAKDAARTLPISTVAVDATLGVTVAQLPAFADGVPRTVAAVSSGSGKTAMFVENEMWLSTGDGQVLEAFLSRWQGQILSTFDSASYGLDDLDNHYLIRVNGSAADLEALPGHLQAIDPNVRGDLTVSSLDGLATLAAGAQEARQGLLAGINWVGEGSDYRNRDIEDAPTGDDTSYGPNAFDWPTHRLDDKQNVGVAEAWRAMDLAGVLTPGRVDLAILDMGFAPDSDWASDWIAISNVPFVEPTGTENLLGCGGGPCPWHGTSVVSAAMAVPNNRFGSAGPAGPVARPIVVFTLYDMFSSITALGEAAFAGADVANMSYHVPVPAALGWTVFPFEVVTTMLNQTGVMLIFAAAGNDGENVDGTSCPLPWPGDDVCYENTWYTPCENLGVICVGGLAPNSRDRHPSSNFGAEDVDIFAPFSLWLGPDPDNTGNITRSGSGTSYSSPFAAGIAALIQSITVELRVDEVATILMESAHGSSHPDVSRTVNAFGAVVMVLGEIPPAVYLTSPAHGSSRALNVPVNLQANTEDFEDGLNCCVVTWHSSVDGELGQGDTVVHTFDSLGARLITASTVDSAGLTNQDSVTITITNNIPSVSITQPASGETVLRGVATTFRGTSYDANEPGTRLDCSNMHWTSSNAGDTLASGCDMSATFTTLGERSVTLTGTDSAGASAEDTISVTVVEPPTDLPPQVQITSLTNGANINVYNTHALDATVSDDNDAVGVMAMQWSVVWSGAGSGSANLGTAQSMSWTPTDTIAFDAEGTWIMNITLTVTDTEGNSASDSVQVQTTLID